MELPEEIQNVLHGAGPRTEVEYRLYWARTYLGKVGAIEISERGIWSITPSGRNLKESDVKNIPAQVRAMASKARPELELEQGVANGEADDAQGWRLFAYRRQDLAKVLRVFEVDHPATQGCKRTRLQEAGIELPP
jgi:restriction system protein